MILHLNFTWAAGKTQQLGVLQVRDYETDGIDIWRRSARYVDEILKGAIPADLPVEQPVAFALVVTPKPPARSVSRSRTRSSFAPTR